MDGYDDFLASRGPALLRTAYLICGDRHLAEDLFQHAMARLLVHWPRVSGGAPEAYARRILTVKSQHAKALATLRRRPIPVAPRSIDLATTKGLNP